MSDNPTRKPPKTSRKFENTKQTQQETFKALQCKARVHPHRVQPFRHIGSYASGEREREILAGLWSTFARFRRFLVEHRAQQCTVALLLREDEGAPANKSDRSGYNGLGGALSSGLDVRQRPHCWWRLF